MRNFLAIYQREIKSYFSSPIAYVVIGLFLILAGIFFYLIISNFVQMCMRVDMMAQQYRMAPQKMNVNMMAIRPIMHNLSLFALFFLPLVTMRLYSDEKRTGTIELLMTSPVTNLQAILGKFAAAGTLFLVMLSGTFLYIIFIFLYGNPEFGPIFTGYLGLFLLGLCYVSFGVFFSTLTDNQIIAAVSTFVFILVFWAIGWVSGMLSPALGQTLSNFSLIEHFDDFAKGVLDTKHILYYISFIFIGLFLSFVSIESTRWRGR
ncbi:ABC transporter [candidate division KSB1 bacterium]|nr:ABC transporter permease [candidate division KSB1 bacterium]RQW05497.1 MAG: ABC transporter [candidate division KSB1 bacterium]